MLPEKTCTKCGELKPIESYYGSNGKGKIHSECKKCTYIGQRKYVVRTKEQRNAYAAAWGRKKLGWKPGEYEKALEVQESLCAICEKPSRSTLHADHNHSTMKRRLLLCGSCNRALGLLGDDPEVARKAMLYLRFFSNPDLEY